jgi:ATP-dependent RNA helicase DHX29
MTTYQLLYDVRLQDNFNYSIEKMARRKKAKNHAVDYRRRRTAPRQEKTVPVSSRAQESLTTLVGRLAATGESSSPNQGCWQQDYDEKRLLQKVTQLHRGLEQLGFGEGVIRVILVNGLSSEGWNLESALDWACLHLTTHDLPSFLTDNVQAVDDALLLNEGSQQLTVVVPVKNQESSNEPIVIEPNVLEQVAQEASSEMRQTEEKDEQQEAATRKAWLLAQYEYEDSDNNSNESLHEQVEEQEEESVVVLSPNEILLGESQEELREVDSILNDEAQKYMMSKHEIKELQKKARQLRKVVEGFRRKVQNSKAAAVKEDTRNPTLMSEKAESDNDDAGVFSMFGQDDPQESVEAVGGSDQGCVLSMFQESEEASNVMPITSAAPDYSIPSKWTGQTPKQILEQWCQKKKLHRPQFHQRLAGGAQIFVNTKPPISLEEEGPFADFTDAQHYLATRALYELNPDLPTYRLLPPVFRDLWLSWLAGVKQEKEANKQQSVDVKERKMKELVDAILSQRAVGVVAKTRESFDDTPAVVAETPEVCDSWEDKVSEPEWQREEISAQGMQLQSSFRERQATSPYQSMLEARTSLPMFAYRQQLLETIQENQVTVLCAETGAGKTTQCGQFLLEEALGSGFGDKISILCTQPRRVSAISVAERVSDEFCDASVGETVGYHIRLESKRSARTRLLFCTTGVVLRRLQDDPSLEGVTHVLVDEVHERQWQIDFLLIALRQLIHTTRKDLKIVLVSTSEFVLNCESRPIT